MSECYTEIRNEPALQPPSWFQAAATHKATDSASRDSEERISARVTACSTTGGAMLKTGRRQGCTDTERGARGRYTDMSVPVTLLGRPDQRDSHCASARLNPQFDESHLKTGIYKECAWQPLSTMYSGRLERRNVGMIKSPFHEMS